MQQQRIWSGFDQYQYTQRLGTHITDWALGDLFLNVLTTWSLPWSLEGRHTLNTLSHQSMVGYGPIITITQRLAVSNNEY